MTPIGFEDGLVLFDGAAQRLHILNSGAAAIWTLVAAGHSNDEAAEAIAGHSGLSFDEAWIHVDVISWLWDQRPRGAAPAALAAPRRVSDSGPPRTYSIRGIGFGFSSEDDETRLRVEAALADCVEERALPVFQLRVAAGTEGEMRLLKDGEEILASPSGGEMAGGVFQALLEAIDPGIDWLAHVHGAAIARDGGAILLPGASGSGKSTLAAFLAGRGDLYLSDDLIAIAADGLVVPWPTPFSIKRGSWPILRPLYPELDRLPEIELLDRRIKFVPVGRKPWNCPPLPIAAIIFPQWSEIEEAGIEPVPPLEALAKLVKERLWLGYPITEARVRRFLRWLGTVPCFEIRYRTLEEAERQIEALLQANAGPDPASSLD